MAVPPLKQGVAPDFQLAANLKEDDAEKLGDPKKLLQQLSDKYNAQKNMYMEARNYYFNLNLWVFYMPILVVQAATTVLTNISLQDELHGIHRSFRMTVAVLNGMLSVWTAAQLKLGWSDKTRSANSSLLKYTDLAEQCQMFHDIVCCQRKSDSRGVVEFVARCYDAEKSAMAGELKLPSWLTDKYKVPLPHTQQPVEKVSQFRKPIVLMSQKTRARLDISPDSTLTFQKPRPNFPKKHPHKESSSEIGIMKLVRRPSVEYHLESSINATTNLDKDEKMVNLFNAKQSLATPNGNPISLPTKTGKKLAPKGANLDALADIVSKAKEQDRLNIENSVSNVAPKNQFPKTEDSKLVEPDSKKASEVDVGYNDKQFKKLTKRADKVLDNDLNESTDDIIKKSPSQTGDASTKSVSFDDVKEDEEELIGQPEENRDLFAPSGEDLFEKLASFAPKSVSIPTPKSLPIKKPDVNLPDMSSISNALAPKGDDLLEKLSKFVPPSTMPTAVPAQTPNTDVVNPIIGSDGLHEDSNKLMMDALRARALAKKWRKSYSTSAPRSVNPVRAATLQHMQEEIDEETADDDDFDVGNEEKNLNSAELLRTLLARYRVAKWVHSGAASYFYILNLVLFYTPLLVLGTFNTVLSSLSFNDDDGFISLTIVKVSALLSILTGLQMTLQWESESSKCTDAYQMYRKLDSEISYRLMLADQGIPLQNTADFSWQCRETEGKTMDSLPNIPRFIVDSATKKTHVCKV